MRFPHIVKRSISSRSFLGERCFSSGESGGVVAIASSASGVGDDGGVVMGSASLTMGNGAGAMTSARGVGCFVMEMTGRSTLGVTGEEKKQNDTRGRLAVSGC